MRKVARLPGVQTVRADQCQFGMRGELHGVDYPIKKPTRWMSNMRTITEALEQRCTGTGGLCSTGEEHVCCNDERARRAAIYPLRLCKAILKGITDHMKTLGMLHNDCIGIQHPGEQEQELVMHVQTKTKHGDQEQYGNERDAITGQRLDPHLVAEGRKLEMTFLRE